jgi:thioredoxin reductase (NADPH)
MTYEVAIIGAGPAGASAAIFAARAKISTVLIDADQGMTRRALVKNHLGLVDGITGPELVEQGHQHAKNAGATYIKVKVKSIAKDAHGFTLTYETGETLKVKQVILALGAIPELGKSAGAQTKPGTEPYIKEVLVVDDQGRTSLPGMWAAGTCAGTSVHTIITAGDGARVAINLVSALKGERYVDHDVL